MKTAKRLVELIFGLMVCAFGTYLTIHANIGLAPWDALHIGLASLTGRSYGDIAAAVSLAIILADFLLGEKIGVGTLLNGVLIGKFVDAYQSLNFIKPAQSLWGGVLLMVAGQTILSFGIFLYMRTSWGCGPRDSLMVAINKRLTKAPVGVARAAVEGGALLAGWLMGAKIGFGTLLYLLSMSTILQTVLKLAHFDPKSVHHEGLRDTCKRISGKKNTDAA